MKLILNTTTKPRDRFTLIKEGEAFRVAVGQGRNGYYHQYYTVEAFLALHWIGEDVKSIVRQHTSS